VLLDKSQYITTILIYHLCH